MNIDDVPQDLSVFRGSVVRDVAYAVDADGNYQAVVSDGWNVKADALRTVLNDIDEDCMEIARQVVKHEVSPLAYYMAKGLMDVDMLADNSGISKRNVKKHLEWDAFQNLDDKTIQIYAETLRITPEMLKTLPEID
ncbi:MAG: hypothetical protein MJZ24_09225 [Paludibacteraceae bacterium]|nr:hypothetical protein [Candidatus Physcocola equi]MCQ2234903.1 hypothetical protein [Paludibacteraceae bacterium]